MSDQVKRARITLEFMVHEPDRIERLCRERVAQDGGFEAEDIEGETSAFHIVEFLLHSNPDIPPYLDLGIELVRTDCQDFDTDGYDPKFGWSDGYAEDGDADESLNYTP